MMHGTTNIELKNS